MYFEDYRFQPAGFIHAACTAEYFETIDVLDRIEHFNNELPSESLDEVSKAIRG